MGGKTALRFAQLFPEHLEKLVVLDMGRKAYPSHHDAILKGLNEVSTLPLKSRSNASRDVLAKYVDSVGIRQFLLKNLY